VKTATQQSWPADQVERWPVDKLVPYARNSRTHSDTQVAQIAASIKEWGWTTPVLVSEDGTLIAGHGRVMAARKLGLPEVPVMIARGWTEAQRRAYVIADNKLALNAGWDEDLLKIEFQELGEIDFNVELVGFSQGEISTLFLEVQEGKTNADEEWKGMPEFEDSEPWFRKVIVHFECQADVDEFFRLIGQETTEKTKSIWHPKKERRDLESARWSQENNENE
jgi:hypothetical protein